MAPLLVQVTTLETAVGVETSATRGRRGTLISRFEQPPGDVAAATARAEVRRAPMR